MDVWRVSARVVLIGSRQWAIFFLQQIKTNIACKLPIENFSTMPDLSTEIFYRTSRSGGKGGQNVNKVETAVEAWWPVITSAFFSEEEKATLLEKLANRINKEGCLIVRSTETRSQLENKAIAKEKLEALVDAALVKQKPRRKSRPSRASIEKRLTEKRREKERKEARKKDW